jgi:hypothetical protein
MHTQRASPLELLSELSEQIVGDAKANGKEKEKPLDKIGR